MSRSTIAVHTVEGAHGSQPAVVLLHGFASSGAEDFVTTGWGATFAAAGRTAHILDLPGHGDSAVVLNEDDGTTTRIVAALIDAISALRRPVDVVGYSLGARLAWELPTASTGLVRRLVLGGLSPFEPFASVKTDELRAAVTGTAAPTDPMIGMMAGMVSAPGRDTASLIALVGGLASEPFDPAAAVPSVPTLFVAGSDDLMTAGIDDLVAQVPGATLTRVPGDHRAALDGPEFRTAALAFLSRPALARRACLARS